MNNKICLNASLGDSVSVQKVNDGDPYGYVTSVKNADGYVSNTIENHGVSYARIYNRDNANNKTDPYFTFTDYEQRRSDTYNGGASYGGYYYVKAEIAECDFTGAAMYMCFRWIP
ncbi:hypothetical protein [Fusibacillus kribbianus]|nr:hypothetical protein [Ruminococcus sp. YH-rum2234]